MRSTATVTLVLILAASLALAQDVYDVALDDFEGVAAAGGDVTEFEDEAGDGGVTAE